jgi:hypothetical protein
MHEHNEPIHEIRIHANCFKCGHDHIHFEFANMVMTFNIPQFMVISEMIMKVRQEVLAEAAKRGGGVEEIEQKVAEFLM